MAKTKKKPALPTAGRIGVKPDIDTSPRGTDPDPSQGRPDQEMPLIDDVQADQEAAAAVEQEAATAVKDETTEAPEQEAPALDLHQPSPNAKPTVRPGLENFVQSKTVFDTLAPAEESDEPVIKTIEKTRTPFLPQPEVNDAKWNFATFDPGHKTAALSIPLALTGEANVARRELDLRRLTQKQAFGLQVLMEGYHCDGHQTDDGSEINSRQQAIRKLLESIADQYVEA